VNLIDKPQLKVKWGKKWLNQKKKKNRKCCSHIRKKIAEYLDDQGLERSCESTIEGRSSEGLSDRFVVLIFGDFLQTSGV